MDCRLDFSSNRSCTDLENIRRISWGDTKCWWKNWFLWSWNWFVFWIIGIHSFWRFFGIISTTLFTQGTQSLFCDFKNWRQRWWWRNFTTNFDDDMGDSEGMITDSPLSPSLSLLAPCCQWLESFPWYFWMLARLVCNQCNDKGFLAVLDVTACL